MALAILLTQVDPNKQVASLAITTQPTTRTYNVNSSGIATLNYAGAVVTATLNDGTTKVITPVWSPATSSITDTTTTKTQTVTATYHGKTVTTTMTINNPVSSIAITTQPTTRTYTVDSNGNATFNFTGAVVTATYANGTTSTITPSWSPTSGAITNTSTSATSTVTASYTAGGATKTATTTMTLNNPLTKIAITTNPTTVKYQKGATFNSAGAVVTATYTNSKTGTVTAAWSPTTLSTVGTQTMTASYGGKTATMSVTVTFLPLAYQQVQYVQNTSNVIIDTGFTPNQNTRVTCRLLWTNISNSYPGGFGAATNYNSNAYECYVYSNTVNWNFYNKTYGADGSLGYTGAAANTIYRIDANKNVFTIKNDSGTTLKTISATNGTFSAPYTLYLFGSHRASALYGRVRFYDVVKIYNNGTLVRNMVPCYRTSDNVTGMYDTVNNVFYARSGLTKGSNVNVEV